MVVSVVVWAAVVVVAVSVLVVGVVVAANRWGLRWLFCFRSKSFFA